MSSLSSSNPIYDLVKELPNDGHALHDIRLRFEIEDIWYIVSTNHPEFEPNKKSKDITLNSLQISDLTIITTVHHTNTVSVIVACSERPVAVDHRGLIRLSNALTRLKERHSRLLEGHVSLSSIPDHNTWIVTMWHFGIDSLHEFTGEKFEMTWEEGENAMIRIYSKDMKDGSKTRIRMERQECPNKTFEKAMKEKLEECRVRYLPMYKGI